MSLKHRRNADRRRRAEKVAQQSALFVEPEPSPERYDVREELRHLDEGGIEAPGKEAKRMTEWKKWILYSKRFWLLIAPILAEGIVRLGGYLHLIPEGFEDKVRADGTQMILRIVEALGAYYAAKAAPALTLSYAKSGGVPEAPFHKSEG